MFYHLIYHGIRGKSWESRGTARTAERESGQCLQVYLGFRGIGQEKEMARVPGFEPGACRLGGGRSIQLSYTRTLWNH